MEILLERLRTKMMLAIPIEIPRQVKKLRPLCFLREDLAISKLVRRSRDIIYDLSLWFLWI